MRIGLALRSHEEYGFGRHLRLLLQGLAAVDADHEYVLFVADDAARGLTVRPPQTREVPVPPRWPNFRWRNGSLRAAARRERLDVMYFHNNTCWRRKPLPTVVCLHHLTWAFPAEHAAAGLLQRQLIEATMRRVARVADRVITDSRAAADDIRRLLGIPAEVLRVAHLAADPTLGPASDAAIAGVRERHGLTRPYVLYTGALSLRKNVETMARAFRAFNARRGGTHELVLVGGSPRAIGYRGLDPDALRDAHVRPLGFVPEADLAPLYSGAAVHMMVSYYEGFGLPVLEAFACGCPSITSTRAACPEIAGDAALTVDPEDTEGIAAAIARVVDDPALRASLIERGTRRVAEFSWERTARQTLAVLAEAAGG